ncbi:MAG: hypothetical protein HY099_03975 [Nitrospirae bacterium]|nr:hypothetical protein [Nitrospirota bacterium]
METTGSILFSILKDLGMEDRFRIGSMQGEWQTLFNEPLSLHTYPVELNRNRLDKPSYQRHT